jgi:acetylornithine deacetylase
LRHHTRNIEQLFDNSVKILTDLIGFKTISGEDNSSLIDYCDDILKKLGALPLEHMMMKKKE